MKLAATLFPIFALIVLLHCGDDPADKFDCNVAYDGKSCDCTLGRETLGFCGPDILGVPSICCAPDGWPASGKHCGCDLVVCVTNATGCKCGRGTERAAGDEVGECPSPTSDAIRCCVDKAGNCGCYPKPGAECGDGATEVDKCDYFKVQIPCAAGQHSVASCDR